MKSWLVPTAFAIAIGALILIGSILPIPLLRSISMQLLQWGMILAGIAVLVGIGNLFAVHFSRVRRRQAGALDSLTLLVALLATLFIGVLGGPSHPWMQVAVEAIIVPVEASLMALLAVTLLYAAMRLLRRRADWMSILFLAIVVLWLLSSVSLPFLGEIPILSDWVRPWLLFSPVAGGLRGLLLGVALGALVTGLRVLFALDRPYGEKT